MLNLECMLQTSRAAHHYRPRQFTKWIENNSLSNEKKTVGHQVIKFSSGQLVEHKDELIIRI